MKCVLMFPQNEEKMGIKDQIRIWTASELWRWSLEIVIAKIMTSSSKLCSLLCILSEFILLESLTFKELTHLVYIHFSFLTPDILTFSFSIKHHWYQMKGCLLWRQRIIKTSFPWQKLLWKCQIIHHLAKQSSLRKDNYLALKDRDGSSCVFSRGGIVTLILKQRIIKLRQATWSVRNRRTI